MWEKSDIGGAVIGPPTEADYAACSTSLVSTSPQSGQTKMRSSSSCTVFGIDRTNFMACPQRGQLITWEGA
jgi:hypothetical protein